MRFPPAHRRAALLLLCGAVLLAAAGCGGGSNSGLSATAFRAQANQICSNLTRQEKADISSTSKAALDRNLARVQSALSQLGRLKPPAADARGFRDLLVRFTRITAFIKANESRLVPLAQQAQAQGPGSRAAALLRELTLPLQTDAAKAAADAKVLGLPACEKGL